MLRIRAPQDEEFADGIANPLMLRGSRESASLEARSALIQGELLIHSAFAVGRTMP
jgi:hypothetical protein